MRMRNSGKTGKMNESGFRVEMKATKEADCVFQVYKELLSPKYGGGSGKQLSYQLKGHSIRFRGKQRGEEFAKRLKKYTFILFLVTH